MKYRGRIVFEGYGIGDLFVFDSSVQISNRTFTKAGNELERFKHAREEACKTFDALYLDAKNRLGEEEATLFQTYRLMAEDLDFEDIVCSFIFNESLIAEEAVKKAAHQLADTFSSLDDEYMRQRADDALEVGKTIYEILFGSQRFTNISKPSIIICNDLTVSALMRFNRKYIEGLILTKGNENSHVSIFARTLEIPTICGVKEDISLSSVLNDKKVILDSTKGLFIIDPDSNDMRTYLELSNKYQNELNDLNKFIGKESVTKDGVKIKINANIASTFEIESATKYDAEGIGLFRSEFIYLSSKDYPSEEFQFNYYREILEEMKDKKVVIRTLDIGADKQAPYFKIEKEDNPALGFRSIRICQKRPEIFLTQLRALYRASIYGNLYIMIPMVASIKEMIFAKEMCKKAMDQLEKEGIQFNKDVKIGAMVETPAAAIMSDDLARYCDFFSIGTNDLSQYTLACDRLNPYLTETYNPRHSAVLRLIKMTVDNAHKQGIPCSMCGELARDEEMLPFLLAIHLDELSCSSAYILKIRKAIKDIDTTKVNVNKYLLL